MNKDFITIETAFLAREIGFNEICENAYDETTKKLCNYKDRCVKDCIEYDRRYAYKSIQTLEEEYDYEYDNKDVGYYVSAVSQSELQKWLREEYKIHISISWVYGFNSSDVVWYYTIKGVNPISNNIIPHTHSNFKTYEKALEAGLQRTLKYLKKTK